MMSVTKMISPSIYLIADHLDAVLALGEDLVAIPAPAEAEPAKYAAHMHLRLAGQRAFLEEVRATETRLVARVLKAREHAEQVRRVDPRLEAVTNLFIAGTHVVADAAADLADSTALDFNTGRDSIAYLRGRGVIGEQTSAPPRGPELAINETFLLAATCQVSAVLDLAAAYLDALELHYDLYGGKAQSKSAASSPGTTPTSPA